MRHSLLAAVALGSLAACAPTTVGHRPAPLLPFVVDTVRVTSLGDGAVHRFVYSAAGPWAVHVLDVELAACHRAVAIKGPAGAIGRLKTSALLATLDSGAPVVGGVNADFFLFTPPGVPVGAMITGGRVITGPSRFPVFAVDSAGRPHVVTLHTTGRATVRGADVAVTGWNRMVAEGVAFFDRAWSAATDTATGTVEVVLDAAGRVVAVDTETAGVEIPVGGGGVIVAGRNAPADAVALLRALTPRDTVSMRMQLAPFHPREAVGGRPVLVRDSMSAVERDSTAFATARHPRTAVGIARDGSRLLLVVVDGRQKPYSDGMSLRELATLMLALGAYDAINLDGGGSTAMVIDDPSTERLRVASRPSDPTGERAVGNALAIIRQCTPLARGGRS